MDFYTNRHLLIKPTCKFAATSLTTGKHFSAKCYYQIATINCY